GVASLCFFFQAEDGIRDFHVTGVQTCALPLSQIPLILWVPWISLNSNLFFCRSLPPNCKEGGWGSNFPGNQTRVAHKRVMSAANDTQTRPKHAKRTKRLVCEANETQTTDRPPNVQ